MEGAHILVVDDDREIAQAIEKLLTREGFLITKAYDGIQALDILASERIHLIIMDVMMPSLDGLSATMKIREDRNIPIIILSAKAEDSDKVLGLSMGADDYMTKPFNSDELVARAKSHLRRYLKLGALNQSIGQMDMTIGRVTLDTAAKQLLVDGVETHLTAKEYQILEFLMKNAGMVFSAETIYERVWGMQAHSVENTVMVHIRRIREKIEINPKEPEYLKVVWGIGYKMENNNRK